MINLQSLKPEALTTTNCLSDSSELDRTFPGATKYINSLLPSNEICIAQAIGTLYHAPAGNSEWEEKTVGVILLVRTVIQEAGCVTFNLVMFDVNKHKLDRTFDEELYLEMVSKNKLTLRKDLFSVEKLKQQHLNMTKYPMLRFDSCKKNASIRVAYGFSIESQFNTFQKQFEEILVYGCQQKKFHDSEGPNSKSSMIYHGHGISGLFNRRKKPETGLIFSPDDFKVIDFTHVSGYTKIYENGVVPPEHQKMLELTKAAIGHTGLDQLARQCLNKNYDDLTDKQKTKMDHVIAKVKDAEQPPDVSPPPYDDAPPYSDINLYPIVPTPPPKKKLPAWITAIENNDVSDLNQVDTVVRDNTTQVTQNDVLVGVADHFKKNAHYFESDIEGDDDDW